MAKSNGKEKIVSEKKGKVRGTAKSKKPIPKKEVISRSESSETSAKGSCC